MKKIILSLSILSSITVFAETAKPEKTLDLSAHVAKMAMGPQNVYRLELREFAAAYFAEEKFAGCLQESIKKNKAVSLKVTALSLKVLECK